MKNFITKNNSIGVCIHPMNYEDFCEYSFEMESDKYDEWLLNGGDVDDDSDENGYPKEGFWVTEIKTIDESDLWFL